MLSLPRLLSIALILGVTVVPKVAYYTYFDASRGAEGDPRLAAFFQRQGWALIGVRGLTEEGGPFARRYTGPGCASGAEVIVVSPNGQDDAMIRELLTTSTRIFYVQRGEVTAQAPRFAIMNRWMGELAQSVGLAAWLRPSPVVAVIEPIACQLESTLPWPAL
jgi:hypothetical protein